MKVTKLVRRLLLPMAMLSALFIITTFTACAVGKRTDAIGWFLAKMDLRRELNPATLFESTLMMFCALSFVPLWHAGRRRPGLPRVVPYFFLTCAVACVFFSADESLMIHENLGFQMDKATGLFKDAGSSGTSIWWVILYGPLLLAGTALALYAFWSVIIRIPRETTLRRRVWALLGMFAFSVPAVLGLEVLAQNFARPAEYMSSFEESFELLGLLCLAACNTTIAAALDAQQETTPDNL